MLRGSSCAALPFVYISHVTRMVNGWLVKVLSSAQLRSAVVKLNVSFSHMAQDVPKRFKHVTCYTFQRYKKSTKKNGPKNIYSRVIPGTPNSGTLLW